MLSETREMCFFDLNASLSQSLGPESVFFLQTFSSGAVSQSESRYDQPVATVSPFWCPAPFGAKTKLNSVALVRERTIPTGRPPLFGEVVPTFADRGCRVVRATDSHGR
jgi:hypothetical protein